MFTAEELQEIGKAAAKAIIVTAIIMFGLGIVLGIIIAS